MRAKAAAASAALVLALAGASPAAAGTTRYVDCSRTGRAMERRERPFNTLARASAVALRPGQRLLLRRGTTCTGTLAPSGSGTRAAARSSSAPTGAAPARTSKGAGEDAVLLKDMSHVVAALARGEQPRHRGGAPPRRARGGHRAAWSAT